MRIARCLIHARQATSRCRDASRAVTTGKKTGAATITTTTTSALRTSSSLSTSSSSSSSSSNCRRRNLSSAAAALPPPTAESQPWPELGDLRELYNSVGNPTRVRQHANPLTAELQVPIEPPADWTQWFDDPRRPLVVDVGCGGGRFGLALLRAADRAAADGSRSGSDMDSTSGPSPVIPGFEPPYNLLGIEIRAKLVERATAWASRLALSGRARFVAGNATVSLPAGLLENYPGEVALACVQYPDPHFKERHRKRRVVQAPFAVALAEALSPRNGGGGGGGGEGEGEGENDKNKSKSSDNGVGRVFLQSDVEEVASSMRSAFEAAASGALEPCHALHGAPPPPSWAGSASASDSSAPSWNDADGGWGAAGWLPENPLRVPTEREVHTLSQGLPVYRFLLVKKKKKEAA